MLKPSVSFVMKMLKNGFKKDKYERLIIHSVQGFQYLNIRFRKFLLAVES
ncbi:transposase for insertion sequence (plasmid) [Tepidibacter aestuarii]|nr:transposase for insertion sequence [Tepidibacter aestuarii]CAH2215679.1 transposase for insertion sequence [Tepidibacter aestuarii]